MTTSDRKRRKNIGASGKVVNKYGKIGRMKVDLCAVGIYSFGGFYSFGDLISLGINSLCAKSEENR